MLSPPATLGRMSHPGRGAQRSVALAPHPVGPPRPLGAGTWTQESRLCKTSTPLLPCLKLIGSSPGANGHSVEGGVAAGQGLCIPSVRPVGKGLAGVWLSW